MATVYDTTLPLFRSALQTLTTLLKKAESHAAATTPPTDPTTLLAWRLAPTMLPLAFQIHEVTDTAAQLVARAHGIPVPTWTPDDLRSFEDVWARVREAEAWLDKADRGLFEEKGKEGREVEVGVLALGVESSRVVSVGEWVQMYAVPTMFFHLSTAYGILRAKGVEVGKREFIRAFAAPWVEV